MKKIVQRNDSKDFLKTPETTDPMGQDDSVLKFCENCGTLKDAIKVKGQRTLICPRCDPNPRAVKRSADSWAPASNVDVKEPRYKTNYEA
ncbi:MAG: hypothetical protein KAR35_06090, partial [Candidatus Heimdallarchaeota archaeon]|nr:hypothetical protein [Candidatus Heimdallarchaeota archaeon]MCK5048929.1 hypothetical protein [Candidatus Heimdallarchaeota archaeon]